MNTVEAFCPGSSLALFESGTWFGLQDEWLIRKAGAYGGRAISRVTGRVDPAGRVRFESRAG